VARTTSSVDQLRALIPSSAHGVATTRSTLDTSPLDLPSYSVLLSSRIGCNLLKTLTGGALLPVTETGGLRNVLHDI